MNIYPKEWIEALRSGMYKQCSGELANHPLTHQRAYCCLGVLCVVSGVDPIENHDKIAKDDELLINEKYRFGLSSSGGILPFCGREDMNLVMERLESLAVLNDEGFTFDQIADLIECFWRVL